MTLLQRYSEPYNATGGLAAEGVINQLGRPDIEPLEVVVREAIQNCWDAKRTTSSGIRVEVGRQVLDAEAVASCRRSLLVDPPPGLPLGGELVSGLEILFFADFGTNGLGGPTRADQLGNDRDFVDFVRNIGQPPDKDLGGGSFGYGKAAFYIASKARTIIVDTLCRNIEDSLERRFIGCALGENFALDGQPYTGRHWWGRLVAGVPEPVIGEEANEAASLLGLPPRSGEEGLGTTIAIVAPGIAPNSGNAEDETMSFIADALTWNFWPRMIDTPGGARRTMQFSVTDRGGVVRIPNPRTHPRLRAFVDAMDRLREEPGSDDDLLIDRSIESLRPARRLGRLVLQRGPVAPADLPERAVPQGARQTADALHHVALMRNAELVVKYLPGAVPVTGRIGYAGVFKCAVDVDEAFRRSEPPTHDDWIYRALARGQERSFVKIALERITGACREAAGYSNWLAAVTEGSGIPLGEFADALAALMPGAPGPGARREARADRTPRRKSRVPGRTPAQEAAGGVWVDGTPLPDTAARPGVGNGAIADSAIEPQAEPPLRRLPPPQVRTSTDPHPAIGADGSPVMRYPFELRTRGNRVLLSATVEVMASDGGQVETEAPAGSSAATVRAWVDPSERVFMTPAVEVGPDDADGPWMVEVLLADEAMMRVDLELKVV
jgi:hypothetical protein